jgi:hypothetical protein
MQHDQVTDHTPRCTCRGCPVRFTRGPDRACPNHRDDNNVYADALSTYRSPFREADGSRKNPGPQDTKARP